MIGRFFFVLSGLALCAALPCCTASEPFDIWLLQGADKKKDGMDDKKDKVLPETIRQEVVYLPPSTAPEMLGDVGPAPLLLSCDSYSVVVPRIRAFKVADNGTARPMDRVFFSFNYYEDLFASANERRGANLRDVNLSRATLGVEKTFLEGAASIALILPYAWASGTIEGAGRSNDSAFGDLAVVFKYAFLDDPETGSVLSGGLAVVTPTGANSFGRSLGLLSVNVACAPLSPSQPPAGSPGGGGSPGGASPGLPPGEFPGGGTTLQPYLGFLWNRDRFFFQGFSSLDIPTDPDDVTLWYNDLGAGFWLYRNLECGFLSGIAPTVELHVSTPLNHRGLLTSFDQASYPDVVSLSYGLNFEFNERSRLAIGAVTPVTGPRPYDIEYLAQVRVRY